MTLVALVAVAAAGIGLLRGGRLSALAAVRLERVWLVVVALAAQLPSAPATPPTRWLLLGVTHVALGLFLWSNRRLPGIGLVAWGWALNATVILANGGMPVSIDAITAAGGSQVPTGTHLPLRAGQRLVPLADVIAVPILGLVVSVGDLVLAAGAATVILRLLCSGPQPVDLPGRDASGG